VGAFRDPAGEGGEALLVTRADATRSTRDAVEHGDGRPLAQGRTRLLEGGGDVVGPRALGMRAGQPETGQHERERALRAL
jgi:hypothetical protein